MTLLFALLCLGTVHAKEAPAGKVDLAALKHPVQPMLWKVEGKGLKKPSYLFGTIHLADTRLTTLHPLAQKAFDQADQLYTEVELSNEAIVKNSPLMMREGKETLLEILGKNLYEAVDVEVKAIHPGLDMKPFERLKIWALAAGIPQISSQLNGKSPLDLQLWNRATKAGKKTGALETYAEQMGSFDAFSVAEQKTLLKITMDTLRDARKKKQLAYQSLVDAYLLGDTEEVIRILDDGINMGQKMDQKLEDKFAEKLLYERNKRMADVMIKVLTQDGSSSHFFAAGTAHYVGKKNISEFLTKEGYKVTAVK